ncbi:MAG: ATP-binding protein, partial [Actinomycetota bacterium]|nr:ATP-binding protein [Actinomycetota bacterium]
MADNLRRIASGELFPTDEPVAGEALIGRADDVDAVASSLLGAINVVLAGPRRLGKTSVARAALEVCRRADAYTVAVDLFKQPDAAQLAESLSVGALANRPKVRQLLARARQAPARARQVASLSATVRLKQELGDGVELAFSPSISERHPDRALRDALELLQRIAAADDKRLILFLDEFQELASPRKPYGDPDALTRLLRAVLQDSPAVTVLF